MSSHAAVCGLKPLTWVVILSCVLVAAIIAIPIGVTQSDGTTTTPGGAAVNPAGTLPPTNPPPTPAPTSPPTPAPTPAPTSPPRQPINLQIFHISDLHGAIGVKGHSPVYQEYNNKGQYYTLDADWGDLLSMVAAARANAAATNNSEFLIFDTGDLVDGTPYSDATSPRGVNMITAIAQAKYDGFAPGNHDLGYADTISLLHNTANVTNAITSNIDYDGKPLGQSYRVITLRSGYRVLVLGFIYDFRPTGPDATVTNITDGRVLKDTAYGGDILPQPNASRIFSNEQYFKDAMAVPNIDLVVTIGHITMVPGAGQVNFWAVIKNTIRTLKPHTPIIQLGGHTHKDEYVLGEMESLTSLSPTTRNTFNPFGQYPGHFGMETTNAFQTVGTLKFTLGDNPNSAVGGQRISNLKFDWVVTNRLLMATFVGRALSNFTTAAALQMKAQLSQWATASNFTTIYGCWPGQNLVTNGQALDPTYGVNNVYLWYTYNLFPTYFDNTTTNIPFYLSSSSSLRGTLYQGNVTQEDLANILPFDDSIVYFKGLSAQSFQWALYYTQTKAYGSASVHKHTECVHDGDVFPQGSQVAHTPSGTYVLSYQPGTGVSQNAPHLQSQNPRKRMHKLSAQLGSSSTVYNCSYNPTSTVPCTSAQDAMPLTADTHPYMYYSTKIPVKAPVPALYGRTYFTYADIAGAYQTPYTGNQDITLYGLAQNATDRMAVRDAFLAQYINDKFDLVTPDYFAIQLYQNQIFAKGGATYGFPNVTDPTQAAQVYPGNKFNYPTAPITAVPMIHQYAVKYMPCSFPTPFTPPAVQN